MLEDLPWGSNVVHASPIRTCPRPSLVGIARFEAFLAVVQTCIGNKHTNKQTENRCIVVE